MDWGVVSDYGWKALGSACATLLITYSSILFAKLKSKILETKIYNFIKKAVAAAEQLYPNNGKKMGSEKYAYVQDLAITKFKKHVSDNKYLNALIEGAVYELTRYTGSEQKTTNSNSSIKSF